MRCIQLLVIMALLALFSLPAPATTPPITLKGEGGAPTLLPASDATATVLVFVTPGCPIANRYAPILADLAREYVGKARFFRVYADAAVTTADATSHESAYHYGFPALFDPDQQAVALCGATRTPEIAVLDTAGALRYRGAVDDQYTDFGAYRRTATKHYLQDALDALLAGKEVPTPRTQALGCFIPEPDRGNGNDKP